MEENDEKLESVGEGVIKGGEVEGNGDETATTIQQSGKNGGKI
jgi:hypothetical protein